MGAKDPLLAPRVAPWREITVCGRTVAQTPQPPSDLQAPADVPEPDSGTLLGLENGSLAPASGESSAGRAPTRWLVAAGAVGGALAAVLILLATRPGRPMSVAEPSQASIRASDLVPENDAVALSWSVSRGDAGVDGGGTTPLVRFRVASFGDRPGVEVVRQSLGKRSLTAVLSSTKVPAPDATKVALALGEHLSSADLRPEDTLVIAREIAGGKVLGFEYERDAFDIWQGLASEAGTFEVSKLEIVREIRPVAKGLRLSDDLQGALAQAGFHEDLLPLIEEALAGRVEHGTWKAGVRLRIVATEELLDGQFHKYTSLDALEYVPPVGQAFRVYHFTEGGLPAVGKAKATGYYDCKGRQPYTSGWRTPVTLARLTSRYNPRRMHPVLHVVMPHNGVDYAAPAGTPVVAARAGVVRSVGDGGPCGNMVQIAHDNGLVTAYCHLQRFAAGIAVGKSVQGRDLVGYVGQTGRATGPHLHFAVKRGDRFVDPLSLRMDGAFVVPPKKRDAFEGRKNELDLTMDGIDLPTVRETGALAVDAVETDAGTGEVMLDEAL
jgi:murein DD-endopeptidase MepM/ murein hydrolase activator NlpD